MNIILFTSADNLSGGSRQALYQAQGLADRGHRVTFLVPRHSELPSLAPERSFWMRFDGPIPARQQIEALFTHSDGNVVHAFHNAAVKALAWWALFWKKKAAAVAHRGVIFRPGNPLPYLSPGIDRFLVNSKACGRIIASLGVRKRRIEYLPNAVPDSRLVPLVNAADLRAALRLENSPLTFLCIGGNKAYKGTEVLLRAWANAFATQAEDQSPRLVLVGQTPDVWTSLAHSLGIFHQLRFAGKREDVGSFLAIAHAFVLPSLSESMPNTLLEALRAGLPSIGTTVGAVPDILAPQDPPSAPQAGLLVPPGDATALAAALRNLANDGILRARLAQAAQEQGMLFSPNRRLDRLEGIYSDILRSKGLV